MSGSTSECSRWSS